ncbi:hypothetical protein MKW92_019301 [Papaver armeniacum]|nr:hypothetical protein MKW92_019301 [Papaver armeniacum]
MSRGNNLLSIQPRDELKFPFQLNKQQASSCLRLTNKSDELHVAFQVKTTNPKKYSISPNMGTIFPKGTCNVMITMQAPHEDMLQCKDKFRVQLLDLREMCKKQSAKVIVFKEFKLRATYVPVGSVTVRRGPPEQQGSSPPTGTASSCVEGFSSFVDKGSQPSCLFDAVARLIGFGSRGKEKKLHLCHSMSSSSTAPLLANIH